MSDPISNLGRLAQTDGTIRRMQAKAATSSSTSVAKPSTNAADSTSATASQPETDQVVLSDVAQQIMAQPSFDQAKVDAIKQALQQGQYPIDSRRIAENFTSIEKMIKG